MKKYISLVLICVFVLCLMPAVYAENCQHPTDEQYRGGSIVDKEADCVSGAIISYTCIYDNGTCGHHNTITETALNPNNHIGQMLTREVNRREPTYSSDGGYDIETYCERCNTVVGNPRHEVIPMLQLASLSISPAQSTINVGETVSLSCTPTPAGTDLTITFSSDSPCVNVNSSTGTVTGISAGTATIIASANGINTTATVTVVDPSSPSPDPSPSPSPVVPSEHAVITYYDDAGTIQGQDIKQPNERYYISYAKCAKTDYVQIKWSTSPNGEGTLYDFGSAYDQNVSLNLYPYWQKSSSPSPSIFSTYKVNYVTNGGVLSHTNPDTYTYGQGYILPDYTKIALSGYTFGGWYTNPGFTGNTVQYIAPGDFGDKTFYAKWIPASAVKYVTVSYSNHGTVYTGNSKVSSGAQYAVRPGESITFTFSPENLYYVYNVKVGGYNLGSRDKYTFSYESMSGNKDMYVSFGSIYGAPKTGDDSDLVLWTVLGVSAMLCGGAAFFGLKKKEG